MNSRRNAVVKFAASANPSRPAISRTDRSVSRSSVRASAIRAARDALNGWDPTGGCLYYYNPKGTNDKWIRTRTVKTVIGNHSFAV